VNAGLTEMKLLMRRLVATKGGSDAGQAAELSGSVHSKMGPRTRGRRSQRQCWCWQNASASANVSASRRNQEGERWLRSRGLGWRGSHQNLGIGNVHM
jgi:hypothetical protein